MEEIVPHQVLCITHLPQLAAFGDKHFTVNKRVFQDAGEERTSTVVRDLDVAARIEELTVMLGATSEAGRRSVEEMMADVARIKSATFEMEWPPKSGRRQSFPEIDRAQWFSLAQARRKINPAQGEFIDRLEALLATGDGESESRSD